jgi:membrane-bound lytic murein transglycosylase D
MTASSGFWISGLRIAAIVLAGVCGTHAVAENARAPMGALAQYSDSLQRALTDQDIAWTAERDSLIAAALNDWLTWMRPTLIEAYEQYMYMRHLMWPVYAEAGLPEGLLFGILAKESGGRVHSVSRMGAAGPLQFMGYTALRLGLRIDEELDERFDPNSSTRANVAYLHERFIEYDGDLALALAAYNAGETRVLRLAREFENPSFWDPDRLRLLPRETQEYVPYVLAAALLFEEPATYGVEFPAVNALPSIIELAAPKTLAELSICIGQGGSRAGWFRTLRNLNPHHEHDARLPRGYPVQVPAQLAALYQEDCLNGSRTELASRLHRANDERRDLLAVRTYTVRSGDTLSTIVQSQGCPSLRAVADANGIQSPRYLIRPGQQLQLLGCRVK